MRGLRLPAPLRGIASILGGSVAGQGVVILAYPLLTRLYTPSEFGLLTVFTSTVILVAVPLTAALDGAIPLPRDDRDAAAVAWAALLCVAATSIVTALVGLLAAEPLAALLGVPQLAQYWRLVALTVLAVGTYEVLTDWMVRGRSYGSLGLRNTLQGVGQVIAQVGWGWQVSARWVCSSGSGRVGSSPSAGSSRGWACCVSRAPLSRPCAPWSVGSAGSPSSRCRRCS